VPIWVLVPHVNGQKQNVDAELRDFTLGSHLICEASGDVPIPENLIPRGSDLKAAGAY
jgi:hypothetical protein